MSLDPGLYVAALLGLLGLSAFLSAARTALSDASRTQAWRAAERAASPRPARGGAAER